jgi:predicted GNAT superfamily acetyltransferase
MPLKEIPEKYKKYDDYKKPFAVSARTILNGILEKGYKIVHENFKRALVQKIIEQN